MSASQKSNDREVWIGMACVKRLDQSRPDLLGGGSGGFINAVCLASSALEFEKNVRAALAENNLDAIEFEDTEPMAERERRSGVPNLMLSLAEQCEADGMPRLGELFIYENEDDSEDPSVND